MKILLIIIGTIIAIAFYLAGGGIIPAIIIGAIAVFLVYAFWDPPKKHKDFSDSDRLNATSRAMGGSGPPELPLPDLRLKKKDKEKRNKH